ncbi:MAG: cation:proton antiporter [Amaricoccus sp.]
MYQNVAIIALFGFAFALVSGPVARSWISAPIVFVAGGLFLGPGGVGLLSLDMTAGMLRLFAELALAMVLFTDAAKADLARIRRSIGLPERLLLIGLPLTILFGLLLARVLFPQLALVELALLATILAPTDAALGEPVVSNAAVPADLREALNVESGLNDGICVPVVLLLIGVAEGAEMHGGAAVHVARTVVEEIGVGLAVGAALALAASVLLRVAVRQGWIAAHWHDLAVVALAIGSFAAAQAIGGSGFIACFVGGLVFNLRSEDRALLHGAEAAGSALSLATWVCFGAAVVWQVSDRITGAVILYAVLSLTIVRMLPVYLSLAGTRMPSRDRLFVGWFGPRGLASIVFGILVIDAGLPNFSTLAAIIVCTVLFSVLAHGATANPLVAALTPRWARPTRPT